MGRWLVKLDDRYLEWSSIVDAPITPLMTEDELREWTRERYGEEGIEHLPNRMRRASGPETIRWNRAGRNEKCLTVEEIIEQYGGGPRTTSARSGKDDAT